MNQARINRDPEAKARAREFRNDMSVSERWLWSALRNDALEVRFRRQYRLGPYILDFYAPAARLCVEVDGEQHADRQEADARRDAYLAEQDILTLRIPSLDLFEKVEDRYSWWVERIRELVEERKG